ncbi:MAG: ABC transporter permease [Candidatus Baltobacteraceae bacterium]
MNVLAAYFATWRKVLTTRELFAIALLAPLAYAFFYPQPYIGQSLRHVPVAVVDQDASAYSRRLVSYVAAQQNFRLAMVVPAEREARDALGAGRIVAYLVVPRELERKILVRQEAHVVAVGNGSYFALNSAALSGFSDAVSRVNEDLAERRRRSLLVSSAAAAAQSAPVAVDIRPLFNPLQGYASYVVPAVALLIVHQTVLLAIGLFLGRRRESGGQPSPYSFAQFAGETAVFATIGFAGVLFFEGVALPFFDLPRGGNPAGTIAFAALFALGVSVFGMLLGSTYECAERGLTVWLFTSVPLFFLSGYAWPAFASPAPLVALRWLFPVTPGMLGMTALAQMNASWSEAGVDVVALGLGILLETLPAWYCIRLGLRPPAPAGRGSSGKP